MALDWNDERVALFKQLHARQTPYDQIAAKPEFNGATVGALGAKARKLGLPKRPSGPRRKPPPTPRPTRVAKAFSPPPPPPPAPATAAEHKTNGIKAMAAFKNTTPQPHNLRIIDEGFGGCKWPISGDGAEMRFCCLEAAAPSPYCMEHLERSLPPAMSAAMWLARRDERDAQRRRA